MTYFVDRACFFGHSRHIDTHDFYQVTSLLDSYYKQPDSVDGKTYKFLTLHFPRTISMDKVAYCISILFLSGKMTLRAAEHTVYQSLSIQEEGLHRGGARRFWKVAGNVFICMTKNEDGVLAKGSVKKVKNAIGVCSPRPHAILTTSIEAEAEGYFFLREVGAWDACARFGATLPLIASTITKTSKGETRGYMLTWRADINLFDFLETELGKLSITTCLHIAYEITHKVSLLHENGWIHGDLKPSNVLVLNDAFYLSDFGFSKQVTEDMPFGGTNCYLSPENIKNLDAGHEARTTLASDAWALGCILYEIYHPQCMRLTHDDSRLLEMTQKELFDQIDYSLKKAPRDIVSIIKGLLTIDPERRLTVPAARDALHALIEPT